MTCSRSLSQLVTWFEQGFPCRNHWLAETAAGRNARTAFLSKYPFRNRPELVEEGIQSPDQVLDFLHRLEVDLRPLGGLNLRNDRAFREGAANIERFKAALAVAVDGKKSLASRIDDDAWSKIPGFGRSKTMDRVVARKIVSTYFPNDTMPIFNTSHLEHFADWLGIKLKELSPSRNQSYASSSGGQKWQLLCQSLIEAKSHLPAIASKDNAYFMGCLYAGYARPGPPFPPNPCAKHPTVRIPPPR